MLTALYATCSQAGTRKSRHRREMNRLSNFFCKFLLKTIEGKIVRVGKTGLFIAKTKGVLSRYTRVTIYVYSPEGNSSGSVRRVNYQIMFILTTVLLCHHLLCALFNKSSIDPARKQYHYRKSGPPKIYEAQPNANFDETLLEPLRSSSHVYIERTKRSINVQ